MARLPWSAVASEAFQVKLNQEKEIKVMQDVIDRLKGSDKESRREQFAAGRTDGGEWAKSDAEASELRRLAAWADRNDVEETIEFGESPMSPAEIGVMIAGEDADVAYFFGEEPNEDPAYLSGWVSGALEVWSKVKPHLR